MKRSFTLLYTIVCLQAGAQEKESTPATVQEQQLESQAELDENSTEDDSYWQNLEYLRTHKLNLNKATAEDLNELHMLSAMQVNSFLQYRKLLGSLVNIYELQAIPTWDIASIRKLLPFVTVTENETMAGKFIKRLHNGEQSLLLRASEVMEKPAAYSATGAGRYLGDASRLLLRYKYNYKNLLQYGVTGDKDAGEPFFKKPQTMGFDFYSVHLFARKLGIIKSLAIGDYTVNMGQGLIQWQSLAFKKSAAVLDVKRQSPLLKPYNSAGEFNFYRGAGITLQYKRWEATVFGSLRKLSANLVADSFQNQEAWVSSLITSGYHRTEAELSDRNNITGFTTGGNIKLRYTNGQIGINIVQHRFSKPLGVSGAPYDWYSIAGDHWSNSSFDYSYTFRNLHVFGEVAADKELHTAMINGLLISLDSKTDMAIVHRTLHKAYQSLFSNAFTENTYPSNESGLYTGITIRPVPGWKVDAYADLFQFPWLKYRVDAPSAGQDYLLQVTYTPGKQAELYTRIKYEAKAINLSNTNGVVHLLQTIPRMNWRTQVEFKVNSSILLRNRVELVWYDNKNAAGRENGFLWLGDLQYKSLVKPWSLQVRVQYFETDGYNSRLYAYESSGLYSFAIPAFYGNGTRYFFNANYRLSKKLSRSAGNRTSCVLGVYIGQLIYPGTAVMGTGVDELAGTRQTEIKIQLLATVK